MKKLAIITILLMLIAGICFAAASDYKVDNNGNIYGYGLHILTTGTFLNILSGSAYFQTPLGISSGGTGTNVAISMVNSFNTRTGAVSLTAADVSSVYTGSTNLTILGTIATGTVPWSHVSSVPVSNSTTTGVLTGTDWTTFNNKLATNGSGSALTGLTYSQLTGTPISNSTTTGMLTPTDWSTFNNKLATNGIGSSLTGITYSQLTSTPISNASTTGMLTGTDWTTFNAKQSALNGAYVASFNSTTGDITTPTVNDTNVTLSMASGQTQTLTAGWTGTLADSRIASASTWNAKQNAIAVTTPLSFSTPTISISTEPSFSTVILSNLTNSYVPVVTSAGLVSSNMFVDNTGVVFLGTGFPQIVSGVTDTTLSSAAFLQAYSDASNIFILSHASPRTVTRYGIPLGGWTEIESNSHSGGTSNGLIIGTQSAVPIIFGTNNVQRMRIGGTGGINFPAFGAGVLVSDSSGTVTSSTSPSISGLTTSGTVTAGNFYTAGTITASVFSNVLSGTTNTFGGSSLGSAGTCTTATATVTGATVGMVVFASPSDGVHEGLVTVTPYISASDTVKVDECAIAAVTPAARRYYIRVIK